MSITYDSIREDFLLKINEFKLLDLINRGDDDYAAKVIDSYMRRAISEFKHVCGYDFSLKDDESGEFVDEFSIGDVDEIVNIITDGMVVQWLKPYVNQQELLENTINTRDYTTYSPSELLYRIGNAYNKAKFDYVQATREYSYNHGDLTTLHL